MLRLAVVGIVIEGDKSVSIAVQSILTRFSDIIIGRMGIPDNQNSVSVISLIIKGENEKISALSGQLGKLAGVSVKTATTKIELEK